MLNELTVKATGKTIFNPTTPHVVLQNATYVPTLLVLSRGKILGRTVTVAYCITPACTLKSQVMYAWTKMKERTGRKWKR